MRKKTSQVDSAEQWTIDEINSYLKRVQKKQSQTPDDPLVAWCTYIKIFEKRKPARRRLLYALLEECYNQFNDNPKYKNDERFIKICIKFAHEDHTAHLLNEMHSHRIGVSSAEFYIAWAERYASSKDFTKANEIYEKGYAANVEPKKILRDAQLQFHAFMGRQVFNKDVEFSSTMNINGILTQLMITDSSDEPEPKKIKLDPSFEGMEEEPASLAIKRERNESMSEDNIEDKPQKSTISLLNIMLSESDGEKVEAMKLQITEFVTSQEEEKSEDLTAWCEFICKLEELPRNHQDAENLFILLQKCYRQFVENPQYKDDQRFIKICIRFAHLDHTLHYLNLMHEKEIGISSSELYVALAEQYAFNSYFNKANEIYEKGTAANSKPKALLADAKMHFHAFIGRKIFNDREEFRSAVKDPDRLPENAYDETSGEAPDPGRSQARFRFTVTNFSRCNERRCSQPFYVRNQPWQISINKKIDDEGKEFLSFYLNCVSERSDWCWFATVEMKLLSQMDEVKHFLKEFDHRMCASEGARGYVKFMAWDKILDPDEGFIKNDRIILEVYLRTEPVGSKGSNSSDSDDNDRDNSADNKKDDDDQSRNGSPPSSKIGDGDDKND